MVYIARFNVGGKYFEVPMSTLERFPETMLARMASETWNDDPQSVMFIERDGVNFHYCLDYMRDGSKVHLPLAVSRESISTEALTMDDFMDRDHGLKKSVS
eukprot:scaffold22589_cov138-Cylindrotheca_fusiformis.AAC.24